MLQNNYEKIKEVVCQFKIEVTSKNSWYFGIFFTHYLKENYLTICIFKWIISLGFMED